jgi:mannose-6-phosphate isomerase-like protein (cupin superfamily)
MNLGRGHRLGVAEAMSHLPAVGRERSILLFRHGTLDVEMYAPRGHDPQQPHTRDEVYVIARGSGTFVCEEERSPFEVGDLLFVPAGAAHRFEDFTDDFAVWVLFYGPEGGEADSASATESA